MKKKVSKKKSISKKGLFLGIILVFILIVMVFVGFILYQSRSTIYIYENGEDCLYDYVPGDGSSCEHCCSNNIMYVTNDKNGDSTYKIRNNSDTIITNYTTNNFIILSDNGKKYIYNIVTNVEYDLPDEIQELDDDILSTSIVIGNDTLTGILIDLNGTKHYSFYSFVVNEYTYIDHSKDGVISYDVNLVKYLDDRYLIVNVTDYENNNEYSLIFDTLTFGEDNYFTKLNFDYSGSSIDLIEKLSVENVYNNTVSE